MVVVNSESKCTTRQANTKAEPVYIVIEAVLDRINFTYA
jgi:hypothetical protein